MKQVLVIFVIGFICISAQKEIANILNHCQSTIYLSDHGLNSSISLALSPIPSKPHYTLGNPCRVHITAPSTHLLYFRIVDNKTEHYLIQNSEQIDKRVEENEELFEKRLDEYVSGKAEVQKRSQTPGIEDNCVINVFEPKQSNNPLYSTNACQGTVSREGGLVSHEADLTFSPGSGVTNRWVLVTAVGAGEICLNPKQHSCLQAGWTPLLCISKDLLCDGVVHCPTGGLIGDENTQFCKDKKSLSSTNWEKLANDFLRKITGKSKGAGSLLPAIQKGQKRWMDSIESSTSPSNWWHEAGATATNNTSTNLNNSIGQYGPWGYLMLGMLICGTVLMFCGLWECCCRKSKLPQVPPGGSVTPSGVSVTSGGAASTAVLVLTSGPPKYEELDQPPSYNVLFPEKEQV